jgi:hypothetical protein
MCKSAAAAARSSPVGSAELEGGRRLAAALAGSWLELLTGGPFRA